MTRDMYKDGVNINLTVRTKLNLFKELENQIESKNNKGTKTLIKSNFFMFFSHWRNLGHAPRTVVGIRDDK